MGKRNKAQSVSNIQSRPEDNKFENGLGEALGYNGAAMNMPGAFGGAGAQISQTGTIQDTLRNYLITNNRQILSQAYVEVGLVQTVIDVPVDDALRGGLIIKTKQLSEKDITELQATMDDEGDLEVLGQAEKWNRLYGGAGVIALTDQDPETPLDMDSLGVGDALSFKAADMWELYYTQAQTDDEERSIEVEWGDDQFFNFYGCDLDPSRVFKLKGKRPPSFLRGRVRGWGVSEVENVIRSINQYLKATDLGFEVLDEFKLDIYKFKGLSATLMGPNGESKIRQRVAIANYAKNYQNAIVLDADDDYDHKQLSFAGLAEAMSGIRMQVASDLRIPISKLFGIAATGFSSGEDDIEVYNSMIESTVRARIKRPAMKMVKLRCQQLFGFIPDDLTIEFKPLRMLSAEQEEGIKEKKFNRLLQARQAGEISVIEFRNAVNRDNLLGIQLDVTDVSILPDDADQVGKPEMVPDPLEDDDEGDSEDEDTKQPQKPKLKVVNGSSQKGLFGRLVNTFKEDDHPRDSDGKFGSGGSKKSDTSESDQGSSNDSAMIKKKRRAGKLEASDTWIITGTEHARNTDKGEGAHTCAHCEKRITNLVYLKNPDGESTVGADCAEALVEGTAKQKLDEFYEKQKKELKSKKAEVKQKQKDDAEATSEAWLNAKNPGKWDSRDYIRSAIYEGSEYDIAGNHVGESLADLNNMGVQKKIFKKALLLKEQMVKATPYSFQEPIPKVVADEGGTNEWTSYIPIAIDSLFKKSKVNNSLEVGVSTGSSFFSTRKKKKKKNRLSAVPQKLFIMPRAFSTGDNLKRILNSADFDRASYEADGGDEWMDSRRLLFFDRDKALDKGRWDHAEERSKEIYGSLNPKFITWFYKKLGGSF